MLLGEKGGLNLNYCEGIELSRKMASSTPEPARPTGKSFKDGTTIVVGSSLVSNFHYLSRLSIRGLFDKSPCCRRRLSSKEIIDVFIVAWTDSHARHSTCRNEYTAQSAFQTSIIVCSAPQRTTTHGTIRNEASRWR